MPFSIWAMKLYTCKYIFADTLYGAMPFLEIDGKPIAQSMALARYLAREHGKLSARYVFRHLHCQFDNV
jgi:glutathione S-transferase